MSVLQTTKIDQFGRVLIPKKIRGKLGLSPGTALKIVQRKDEIVLCPVPEMPALVQKGGVLVAQVEPCQDLTRIEMKLREKRLKRLAKHLAP